MFLPRICFYNIKFQGTSVPLCLVIPFTFTWQNRETTHQVGPTTPVSAEHLFTALLLIPSLQGAQAFSTRYKQIQLHEVNRTILEDSSQYKERNCPWVLPLPLEPRRFCHASYSSAHSLACSSDVDLVAGFTDASRVGGREGRWGLCMIAYHSKSSVINRWRGTL